MIAWIRWTWSQLIVEGSSRNMASLDAKSAHLYEVEVFKVQSLDLAGGDYSDLIKPSSMTRPMFENVVFRRVQMLVKSCGNRAQHPVGGTSPGFLQSKPGWLYMGQSFSESDRSQTSCGVWRWSTALRRYSKCHMTEHNSVADNAHRL